MCLTQKIWVYISYVYMCFIFFFSDNSREVSTEVLKSTRDMYGKSQKERMDNLDQANQEIDRLRKQLDKLQVELQGEYWQREKNSVLNDKLVPVKTNWKKTDWFKGVSLDTSVSFYSWNFYQFLVTFYTVYLHWMCMRTFLCLVLLVPSHSAYRFLHAFSFKGKNIKMFELWCSSYEFHETVVKKYLFLIAVVHICYSCRLYG
jgi:hypothetical protein